jgi:hypothetical protein
VTAWRREASVIVWTLLILPLLAACVALAQGTPHPSASYGLMDHGPEILAIFVAAVSCYAAAAVQHERTVKAMKEDRGKDIAAATMAHDALASAHRVASDHNHRPLELQMSGLGMRIHDMETSVETLHNGQNQILDAVNHVRETASTIDGEVKSIKGEHARMMQLCGAVRHVDPNYHGPLRRRSDAGRG